jgi:hypothetical protein
VRIISAEEQKRERRQKIAENKQRRLLSNAGGAAADGVSFTDNDATSIQHDAPAGHVTSCDSHDSHEGVSPDGSDIIAMTMGHARRSSESSMDDDNHSQKAWVTTKLQQYPNVAASYMVPPTAMPHAQTPEEAITKRPRGVEAFETTLRSSHAPINVAGSHGSSLSSASNDSGRPSSSTTAPAHGHAITQDADLVSVAQMSAERAEMIYNMAHAFRQSFDMPVAQSHALKSEGTTVDFLNMADLTIRRLVKMARHLPQFRALDQQHQIDLLKGSVIDVLLLRSIKNFDLSRQGWMTQTSQQKQFVSASNFKADAMVGAEYYRNYARAAVALQEASQRDAVVLMLLIVLSLFNPKYLVSEDAAVYAVQCSRAAYIDVLKEYLLVKYGDTEGLLYTAIALKLDEFLVLGSFHNELLKHTNACELEPLVVEMFDLS